MSHELLEDLSPPQKEVVLHPGGPLLVLSGAGSGKTLSITHRTARLIFDGVPPEKVLVATFTNRAAEEFKNRLSNLLNIDVKTLWMGTLHSTGAKILRAYGQKIDIPRNFTIYDEGQKKYTIYKTLKRLNIDINFVPYTDDYIISSISRYKEQLWTPQHASQNLTNLDSVETEIVAIYSTYQEILEEQDALDFDDLVMKSVLLLRKIPGIKGCIDLHHVLVDEFQDTNPAQFEMLQLLLGNHQNITAVGDPDQAIYAFRNADSSIIVNFKHYFPEATIVSLGQNYRCTKDIVEAAATVVARNKSRIMHKLWSDKPTQHPIKIVECHHQKAEYTYLCKETKRLHDKNHLKWSDIAILYRTKALIYGVARYLYDASIPYKIIGSDFFKFTEIKEVLDYLRFIRNQKDGKALRNAGEQTASGVGRTVWKRFKEECKLKNEKEWDALSYVNTFELKEGDKKKLHEFYLKIKGLIKSSGTISMLGLVHLVTTNMGIWDRYENKHPKMCDGEYVSPAQNLEMLDDLIQNHFGGSASVELEALLDYIDGAREGDLPCGTDAVNLLTIHASKGSEFEAVFMIDLVEGVIPHWKSREAENEEEAIEEERRLFYVGMTRAKEHLHMLFPRMKVTAAESLAPCLPSRFIGEIPKHLVNRDTISVVME